MKRQGSYINWIYVKCVLLVFLIISYFLNKNIGLIMALDLSWISEYLGICICKISC